MKDFCGHPVESLDNGKVRLEYLTDVGPRIARIFAPGSGVNLLAELPDLSMHTPHGRFEFMGGHRLWHSPEAFPRTYVPDQAVTIEQLVDGIRLNATAEPETDISKTLEIHMAEGEATFSVDHVLRNDGHGEVQFAPWALTMFRQGGVAILPQPAIEKENMLLPNRLLSLWPYTQISDQRLHLADDFITIDAKPALPAVKIGNYNSHGWIAYWIEGTLIVKRFAVLAAGDYPDMGSNVEIYCNDRFIELETLSALTKIAPGQSVVHRETWEFYGSLDQPFIPEAVRESLD
jgi:hypothetical protein